MDTIPISTNSDQRIGIQFRKKNRLPINPNDVHIKGKLYTNPNTPFEFELNKGVLTNCTIKDNIVWFNITPNFKSGTVVFEGYRFTSSEDVLGKYIKQELDINITSNADVRNLQDYAVADVILYGEESDATEPINPTDVNKIVQDYLTTNLPGLVTNLIQTSVVNEVTKQLADNLTGKIDTEVINKINSILPKIVVNAINTKIASDDLAKNNLEDVDLAKLLEKGNAAGLASKDLSNVKSNSIVSRISTSDADNLVKNTPAFEALSKSQHDAVKGKTKDEIKALFYTNRYETQTAIDLSQSPYKDVTTLLLVFQFTTNNQTIEQTLPPIANNQIIMIETILSSGITNPTLKLLSTGNDKINGASIPITISENGYNGYMLPIINENSYDFISHHQTQDYSLTVGDDKGNIVIGAENLKFKGLTVEHNDDIKQTSISIDKSSQTIAAKDNILNQEFNGRRIQSLDKSIKVSALGVGRDKDNNEIYDIDLSIMSKAEDEGVALVTEYTHNINLGIVTNQPSITNMLYSGGMSVEFNKQTGGIVTQEIDNKDPNVTGGTTFVAMLDYVPNLEEDNTLSQDGSIKLELVDKDGNYIDDINGRPAIIQRDYKAGDVTEEMHLVVVFKAKGYKEVFYKISGDFEQEEDISVGLGTGICIQAVTENSGLGSALTKYLQYTDNHIELGKVIYGENNINFARVNARDTIVTISSNETTNLGNNLKFDFRTALSYQVINNGFNIKSTTSSCIFSLYKKYTSVDLMRLKGCDIDISVEIQNKQNAFDVVMLGYKGILPAPEPILNGFSNQQPVYENGWTELDKIFISEDVISDKRRIAKTFTFPLVEDYNECVFMLRPNDNSTPVDVTIYDFEGDIKPSLTYVLVKEKFYRGQQNLVKRDMFTKSAILCPNGEISLRFTINAAETKLPIGIFKKNSFIKNNNAWYDIGSANKELQGDALITKSFVGTMSCSFHVFNEQGTDNTVEFYVAKVETDGNLTPIDDSKVTKTIKANTLPPNGVVVTIPAFKYNFKKGESYRLIAKANKDDGAFIQVNNSDHIAMVETIMQIEYFTEIPEDILKENGIFNIQLTKGGKPVDDISKYNISIDVDTNKITVITK